MRDMTPQDQEKLEALLIKVGQKAVLKQESRQLTESIMARVFNNAPIPWFRQRGAFASMVASLLIGLAAGAWWMKSNQTVPIRLALEASRAQTVSLAGDFTNWQTVPLRREGSRWVIDLRVPKGRHQYAFILNDRLLVIDPQATDLATDERGRTYSVLDTQKRISI